MKESSKGVVIGDRKPGKAHPIRSNREAGSGYDVNVSFSRTGRSTRGNILSSNFEGVGREKQDPSSFFT